MSAVLPPDRIPWHFAQGSAPIPPVSTEAVRTLRGVAVDPGIPAARRSKAPPVVPAPDGMWIKVRRQAPSASVHDSLCVRGQPPAVHGHGKVESARAQGQSEGVDRRGAARRVLLHAPDGTLRQPRPLGQCPLRQVGDGTGGPDQAGDRHRRHVRWAGVIDVLLHEASIAIDAGGPCERGRRLWGDPCRPVDACARDPAPACMRPLRCCPFAPSGGADGQHRTEGPSGGQGPPS